jgi:hypothetical protein
MTVPQINLDFTVHWCPRHLEPFRADWPDGCAVAMVRLFDAIVADPVFVERMPKATDGRAKTEALDAALREHSPLCCWLGDERMRAIYLEVGKEPPR